MVMGGTDASYEGGAKWPPVPFFLNYAVHYVLARKYQSVWRFNPSDAWGKRKPLAFMPEE